MDFQCKRDMDIPEGVQQRAMKMVKRLRLEHLACVERLSELGLFLLEKRRLKARILSMYINA